MKLKHFRSLLWLREIMNVCAYTLTTLCIAKHFCLFVLNLEKHRDQFWFMVQILLRNTAEWIYIVNFRSFFKKSSAMWLLYLELLRIIYIILRLEIFEKTFNFLTFLRFIITRHSLIKCWKTLLGKKFFHQLPGFSRYWTRVL